MYTHFVYVNYVCLAYGWKCYICFRTHPNIYLTADELNELGHFTCSVGCLNISRQLRSKFVNAESQHKIQKLYNVKLYTNIILPLNDEASSPCHVGLSTLVDEFENPCAGINIYTFHLLFVCMHL